MSWVDLTPPGLPFGLLPFFLQLFFSIRHFLSFNPRKTCKNYFLYNSNSLFNIYSILGLELGEYKNVWGYTLSHVDTFIAQDKMTPDCLLSCILLLFIVLCSFILRESFFFHAYTVQYAIVIGHEIQTLTKVVLLRKTDFSCSSYW